MAEWIRNRVTEEQWRFVDAQIAMVRGRLVELKDRSHLSPALWEQKENVKQQLHNLLILRLGMSIGHDTTVESAVTQVLNWKDGER